MSKATVLLVGAEDGLSARGKRALADPEKFEIQTCTGSTQVVAAVQESSPDVVVVDLGMPAMDGVEVLNELRRKELIRFVPLAVIGRDEGIAWRAELFRSGVADIIDEKVDDAELRRRLDALLEGRPWGAEEVGDAPAGPAVEAIAALEREKKSGRLVLARDGDAGEIVVEKGVVKEVRAGQHEGEEALNLVAGSPGWTAAPKMDESEPPPSRPSQRVPLMGEAPRVLLVDDDRTVLRLFEIFLGRHGYRIVVASNGREGYTEARRDPPDVIITDVMMPETDGWWLLTRLRQDFLLRDVTCLFFTNKGPSTNKIEEVGVKPDRYLEKDPHLNNVTRALEEALAPTRKLLARLSDTDSGTVQGKVAEVGVMPLLRTLRSAKRSGRLVLTSAPGQTAVLAIRDDVLTSAKLSGKERADGVDALTRIVAGEWGSFRFEPNVAEAAAEELGPLDKLLREACDRNQRFFELVKIHALSSAGGIEKDAALADRYRAAAPPKIAPVVRAVVRGENAEAIARSTGMELPMVEHVLFEMLRQGVFKMQGAAKPTPVPVVPSPGARTAALPGPVAAGGAAGLPLPTKTSALKSPLVPRSPTMLGVKAGPPPAKPPSAPVPTGPAAKTGAPPVATGSAPVATGATGATGAAGGPGAPPVKSGSAPVKSGSAPVKSGSAPVTVAGAPIARGGSGPAGKAAAGGGEDEEITTGVLAKRLRDLPPPSEQADSALPPLATHASADPDTLDPDEIYEELRPPTLPPGAKALKGAPGAAPAAGDDLPAPAEAAARDARSDEAPRLEARETPQPVPMVPAPVTAGGRSRRAYLFGIGGGAVAVVLLAIVVRLAAGGGGGETVETAAATAAPHTGEEYAAHTGEADHTAATDRTARVDPDTGTPETAAPETTAPETHAPRTATAPRTADEDDGDGDKPPKTAKAPHSAADRLTSAPRTAAAVRTADADEDGTKAPKTAKEPRTAKGPDPEAARKAFDDGNKLFLKGSKAGAIAAFKKAARYDPSYPDPHRGLALCYVSLGKKAAAQKELDVYLRLKPGAKDAAYVKKKIDELGS